jgi:hypothetical protein
MKTLDTAIAAFATVVLSGLVYVDCTQMKSLCAESEALDMTLCHEMANHEACAKEAHRKYEICVRQTGCPI